MRIHINQIRSSWAIKVKQATGSWADRHGKMTVADARKLNANCEV